MSAQMPTEMLDFSATRLFSHWLSQNNASLAISSDTGNCLILLGFHPDGNLRARVKAIPHCSALHAADHLLWMASLFQLLRMPDALLHGPAKEGNDAFYVPRVAWTIGDLGVEDIAQLGDGSPVFVSSGYSCVATVDETYSMRPLWRPPFITALEREDRCHLNGLALVDAVPRYVTCLGQTDHVSGWRAAPIDSGALIDMASGETIAAGLSLPNSPRWHAGKLWLLNSGTCEFGHVELDTGRFVPLAFCSGFARGLTFIEGYAVIGVSHVRDGSPAAAGLDAALAAKGVKSKCAILVVDLSTGDVCHSLVFKTGLNDVFAVEILRDVRAPGTLDYNTDEFFNRIDMPPQPLPPDRWMGD